MNIINTTESRDLKSVNFFTNYMNWAKNINANSSSLTNNSLKVASIALSAFVFIGSLFIFVFRDIPALIKQGYDFFTKSNPSAAQITKPFLVIGAGYLVFRGCESIINKINNIKKNVLITVGITVSIGIGLAVYSMGYLHIE